MNEEWTDAGVKVVNGAKATNSLVFYSAKLFFEDWINGANFETAVLNAYAAE